LKGSLLQAKRGASTMLRGRERGISTAQFRRSKNVKPTKTLSPAERGRPLIETSGGGKLENFRSGNEGILSRGGLG